MKKLILFLLLCGICMQSTYAQDDIPSAKPGVQYGKPMQTVQAINVGALEQKLSTDTVYVGQVEAKVVEVCKKKGCFIRLERKNGGDPVLVRFKDYAFFMPQDIVGKTVVLEGSAKVKETSVERLRHWAEDAGKAPDEIAKITTPKTDIEIIAEGVMVMK